LQKKTFVGPVLIKRKRLLDFHRIYQKACSPTPLASGTDNPVADPCCLSYPRFAGCERAHAMEWIRREAVVPGYDVRIDGGRRIHQQFALAIGRAGRG